MEQLLTQPAFAPLTTYFSGFTLDDFANFRHSDFAKFVCKKDRARMKLLLTRPVMKKIKFVEEHASQVPLVEYHFVTLADCIKNGVLGLQTKLASTRHRSKLSRAILLDVDQLPRHLESLSSLLLDSIVHLNVDGNNLYLQDVPYIIEALRLLPNCKSVNLNRNTIGLEHWHRDETSVVDICVLYDLLAIERLKCVKIVGNPMACIEGATFFGQLYTDPAHSAYCHKLIWIPSEYVEKSQDWAVCLKHCFKDANTTDREHLMSGLVDKIYQAHKAQY